MTTALSQWGASSPFPEELGKVIPLQTSGTRLEMEVVKQHTTTIPTHSLASRHLPRNGQGPYETFKKESDRKSKVQQVYMPSFLGAKEKFNGKQDHIGPVSPEPIYPPDLLQNAYFERG